MTDIHTKLIPFDGDFDPDKLSEYDWLIEAIAAGCISWIEDIREDEEIAISTF
ncbi:hypothetical protein [Argonema galeatum]|uniref:hypothetical protein n=1 Tax=Argonema galeatum TaxID=2942762 RepID=UPI0020135379|nr:hypothetical protein [Argonema galeatum]MCL1464872.1 hypothetical protein [Argonema galeatum A003/A1]